MQNIYISSSNQRTVHCNKFPENVSKEKSQFRLFIKNGVLEFFHRNSRVFPGKKDTITHNKTNRQKRYFKPHKFHKKLTFLGILWKVIVIHFDNKEFVQFISLQICLANCYVLE